MPLNPFAREYVPGVGKQISLLNVSSVASPVTKTHLPTSPEPDLALSKDGTQPVGSSRCPTPAAEALEVEELQFEDVFEAEAGPPSPRSHLSPVSPGGLSMVRALQQHQQTTALICWICSQSYLFLLVCSHQVVQSASKCCCDFHSECCRCQPPRLLVLLQSHQCTQHCHLLTCLRISQERLQASRAI